MKQPYEKNQSPIVIWCLGLSIVLHLIVLAYKVAPLMNPEDQLAKHSTEPIEITDVPKEYLTQQQVIPQKKIEIKEKQIAETEDANNREIDPNAKFLGEHNQKVEKQVKAKAIDDFRAKTGTGSKKLTLDKDANIPPTGEAGGTESPEVAIDGEGMKDDNQKKGVKRNWKTLSLKDLSVGGDGGATAATDDNINGVGEGNETVLSTREFRFFSYYNRIKELLRQYWKPNVERQVARIWNKGRQINDDELTTKVLVLLDEKGGIIKISKLAGSGFSELDEAAVEAFQKAGPFPNPPKGIVDADGFVRIRWDFILKTENGPRIQFRTSGQAPN